MPETGIRRMVIVLIASAGFATAAGVGGASELQVGELVEPFQLYDQYDALHDVDTKTRVILFSRDMSGGGLLKNALSNIPKGFLTDRGAVYVADISKMPSLIAKFFALPSMRRRPYSMLLDRDGESTRIIPDVDGQATLVFLDALQVERIEHVAAAEKVKELLDASETSATNADPQPTPSVSAPPIDEAAEAPVP